MRAIVPPRLVPANPHTKTLYPGAESSAPIFSARSARSCPMNPSRSSACAVVSKGMRESSHFHRSFAAGSSVGFGAGLVVMNFLRARYPSTLKSRPHAKTGYVLSSRYGRIFRPLHVHRQNSRRRGHQDWPQHQAQHSEQANATDHADEDHQPAQFSSPAEQQRPQEVVHDSGHSRANHQQKNGPTPMSRETQPQRRWHEDQSGAHHRHQRKEGHGHTPEKWSGQLHQRKAKSADCALNGREDKACGHTRGNKVPRLRHQRLSMFGIKRENAADSPDDLVRVAEKIKHREDHHEQIENERRDIAQDRAEALRKKY